MMFFLDFEYFISCIIMCLVTLKQNFNAFSGFEYFMSHSTVFFSDWNMFFMFHNMFLTFDYLVLHHVFFTVEYLYDLDRIVFGNVLSYFIDECSRQVVSYRVE